MAARENYDISSSIKPRSGGRGKRGGRREVRGKREEEERERETYNAAAFASFSFWVCSSR